VGEHGRDLYVKKQREMVQSKVHLVEIDLLRGGEHTMAVPRNRLLAQAGPFDYHARWAKQLLAKARDR
jgi:Protein of unknown function (DUF4058)